MISCRVIVLTLLTLLIFTSCSESETYTPMNMFQMAYDFDKSIEEVRVKDKSESIRCNSYPKGCIPLSPKRFKIRMVEMIVVQYHSKKGACQAAKKLDQYYIRNWLLDDVKGEPVLEDFVKTVYKAENPSLEYECD